MTPHQFWHEDMDLINIYSIAYNRDLSITSWSMGQMMFQAVGLALSALDGKTKPKFPEYKDPFESKPLTEADREALHRDMMAEQQAFLRRRNK